MKNAQKEFLQFTQFRKVKAVHLRVFTTDEMFTCNLRVGYTPEEYEVFLRKMDFMYNPCDLCPMEGYIWFEEEDIWGERSSYGEWVLHWKPEIPNHLVPLASEDECVVENGGKPTFEEVMDAKKYWDDVPSAKDTRRLC